MGNLIAFNMYIMVLILISRPVFTLRCFVCEDCSTSGGNDASLFRLEDCPKNANVSCFRSIVNFGTHTVSSRSCSGAPSISEARCSGHVVNALRTEICLCGTNGCNGLHNHEMNIEGRNLVHSSGQGHFNPIKRGMFVGTFVVIKVML